MIHNFSKLLQNFSVSGEQDDGIVWLDCSSQNPDTGRYCMFEKEITGENLSSLIGIAIAHYYDKHRS